MLKPRDSVADDGEERPVGELVQQLVDEGKAYARAELGLAKAIAAAKARAAAVPAAFLGAAFLLAQAAIIMLAFALFSSIFTWIGPVAAAVLTAALLGGAAYWLVRLARQRLEDLL